MGSILPTSLNYSKPKTLDDLNNSLLIQKIGDALVDLGGATGNFGDKAANFGNTTIPRANQYQQELNNFNIQQEHERALRQQEANRQQTLKQQEFLNNLALNRYNLAKEESEQTLKQQGLNREQALKQQDFMNNLALNRDTLAKDEYKLRLASLMNKNQPNNIANLFYNNEHPNTIPSNIIPNNASVSNPINESINDIKPIKANKSDYQFITYDTLPSNVKAGLDRVSMVYPDIAKDALDTANYKLSFSQLNKLYKNPSDINAIRNLVRTINPKYDPSIARDVEAFHADLNNPKSRWADTKGLAELQQRNRDLQEYAKNIPTIGISGLNEYVYQPLARLLGGRGVAEYDQALDQYAKSLERTLLGGKPTVSSLNAAKQQLATYLGPHTLNQVLKDQQLGFDKQTLDLINQAYHRTHGYSGLPSDLIDQNALNKYINEGFVKVENGRIIPLINQNEFEEFMHRRNIK